MFPLQFMTMCLELYMLSDYLLVHGNLGVTEAVMYGALVTHTMVMFLTISLTAAGIQEQVINWERLEILYH